MTRKNISRAEALTIFQNLQLPLGHPFKLSDISADNNPAHAGHRNPVLFTSCRRCYVPRLQTQLFRKTSREMQYLLLRITGQQDLALKGCKVKSICGKTKNKQKKIQTNKTQRNQPTNQPKKTKKKGNGSLLFIQKKKKVMHEEIPCSPPTYFSLSKKCSIFKD